MCYTHTLYFTACGCYSKPQIYGEPCIRAVKGAGLSSLGCWDKIDYGIDSVEEACRRCRRMSLSSSSDQRRLSDTTTLADSRRPSDASLAFPTSAKVEAQDEVRGDTPDGRRTALLTPPGANIKRVASTISFSSASSTASSASRSDQAKGLLNRLPSNIPTIKRCPSGVSLSDNYAVISKKPKEAVENMHWRAYKSGLFKDSFVVESASRS
jgi:hypothetical protein